jgi:hypothetical protein
MTILALGFALLLAPDPKPDPPPEEIAFAEFFDPAPSRRGLKPSARLLGVAGKRVRIVGFMAQMEKPPKGGFILCSRPVFATEAGGGTADLPPDAVLVVVQSAAGKELEKVPGPLEVTGLLELGVREDEDGRVSRIRIILDKQLEVNR